MSLLESLRNGHIVVGDNRYPITDVSLIPEGISVATESPGPYEPVSGTYLLRLADGTYYPAVGPCEIDVPRISSRDTFKLTINIHVNEEGE